MRNRDSIYPELNNKEWLEQKYLVEKLSTLVIAKIIGAKQSNSVRQALIKFNIPLRDRREGQVVNRIDNVLLNIEVITGSLLGDTGLNISNKNSEYCAPYLYKKNKFLDHLSWFSQFVTKDSPINIKEEKYFFAS